MSQSIPRLFLSCALVAAVVGKRAALGAAATSLPDGGQLNQQLAPAQPSSGQTTVPPAILPPIPPGRPNGPIPPGQTGGPRRATPPDSAVQPGGSGPGAAGQRTVPPFPSPPRSPGQQVPPAARDRQIGPQTSSSQRTAGKPGQPGAQSGGERRSASCEELRRNAKFNILFEKVDIEKLVQTVADATCKTFILPDTLRGKISIIGPENGKGEVDADQFYAAFLAALDTNNLTVYPYGRFLKIVDKNKSKQSPIPTLVEPEDGYTMNEQMVTRFFKVRYVEVDRLKGVLQSLVSQPGGDLIAFEPDTLIITDEGSNMHRLERIIRQLDAPSSSSELRVIHLNYAAATDVADKIQKLFEAKGARPGARPGVPTAGGVTPPGGVLPPGQPAPAGQPSTHVEGSSTGPATLSQMIPDERTNKLIIVASPAAFERITSLIAAIDVPIAGEGRINVYFLQNTAAEDIAATLQALAQGTQSRPRVPATSTVPGQPFIPGQPRPAGAGPVTAAELFSGEVKISADKSSNALVIVASQNDYRSLRRIIEELDLPKRQVFIETVIMEVNLDRSSEFGINFSAGYVLKTDAGNVPALFGTKLRQSTPWTSLANLTQFNGFLAGLQGPNIPELEKLGLPVPQFGVVLHALQQSSDVNVLSTPHILASDNEEAEITVGQNVPFQAGFSPGNLGALTGTTTAATTGATTSAINPLLGLGSLFAPIQRQNVELKLTVKPHINKSDEIRMVINESTEEIASQDPVLGPTTSKRSAKTTVVAKDQQTVVLGGIMQDRTIESVSKVPVLGDIPILGHLFRDQTRKKVKTNLLLFLTPYIIKDKSDFRRIFEKKMKERQQFIELFYGQVPGYDVAIDFGRKAGPVARVAQLIRLEEQKIENGGPGLPGERIITPAPRRVPGAPPDGPGGPPGPGGNGERSATEPPPRALPPMGQPRSADLAEDPTGKASPGVLEPHLPPEESQAAEPKQPLGRPSEPALEPRPTPDDKP